MQVKFHTRAEDKEPRSPHMPCQLRLNGTRRLCLSASISSPTDYDASLAAS